MLKVTVVNSRARIAGGPYMEIIPLGLFSIPVSRYIVWIKKIIIWFIKGRMLLLLPKYG